MTDDDAVYHEYVEPRTGKTIGYAPVRNITKAQLEVMFPGMPVADAPITTRIEDQEAK